MVSERITDGRDVKQGDVVLVATKTRAGHWWKRFAVVADQPSRDYIEVSYLKLDMSDPDNRVIDIEIDVVSHVPNESWPQGVSAMYAKALAKGWIELG